MKVYKKFFNCFACLLWSGINIQLKKNNIKIILIDALPTMRESKSTLNKNPTPKHLFKQQSK